MINLFPWRSQLRQQQRQKFIVCVISATVIAVLAVGLMHIELSRRIRNVQSNYQQLQIQKLQLEKTLANYQTQQRNNLPITQAILLLYHLKAGHENLLQLVWTLAEMLPPTVYLTHLTQMKRQIVLMGIAHKHQNIVQLLQNLEANHGIKKAKLLQSLQQVSAAAIAFKIILALHNS